MTVEELIVMLQHCSPLSDVKIRFSDEDGVCEIKEVVEFHCNIAVELLCS